MSFRHRKLNRRVWHRVRLHVLNRDKWTCQSCGKRGGRFHVDHIVPLKDRGAQYDPGNLQTLCRRCHSDKTATENPLTAKSDDEAAWDSWLNLQSRENP